MDKCVYMSVHAYMYVYVSDNWILYPVVWISFLLCVDLQRNKRKIDGGWFNDWRRKENLRDDKKIERKQREKIESDWLLSASMKHV